MKNFALLLMLLCSISAAFADTNWNVQSGNWNVASNWTNGVPNGTNGNVNLNKNATSVCTLNTDAGLLTVRLVAQNGQTWNIENGGRVGFAWSRVGRTTAAKVNMSGDGTFIMNNDDLYIGLENGSCEWVMSDTSSININVDADNGEELYIAANGGGTALFKLIGSGVTVNVDRVHLTARSGVNTATLEYVMDAGGASTIVAQIATIGAYGTANLVLSATADLPEEDIVLIESTSTTAISGSGFATMNGGPATEGTPVVLGGNIYTLSYAYNVTGDAANDVALVFVSTGKHLATTPTPADKTTLGAPPTTLSWVNPDPNDGVSDIICTVSFGIGMVGDPNMDSVTLAPNANSVEINAANFPKYGAYPIADANDFYWKVDCNDLSPGVDIALGKAPVTWSFKTLYNSAPTVNAGSDQLDWGLPKTVTLQGTANDDGRPIPPGTLTVTWTRISGPDSAVINSPSSASTTVDITASGLYIFELSANDGDQQVSDTVQVIIGEDSCEASYLNGANYNDWDFDTDCDVDFADFADFAADWLACTDTLVGCN